MSRPTLSVVSPAVTPPSPGAVTWGTWEHGRTRTVNGRTTYYLRKRFNGHREEFAIANDHEEARAEWALFSRDPGGYKTPKERAATALARTTPEAVCLDDDTFDAFIKWAHALQKTGQMSLNHVRGTLTPYLTQWMAKLKGHDLHTVTLDNLQDILAGWPTARHKRIVALKTFARWARTEKKAPKLRRQADPTLDLQVPEVTPAKARRRKGYTIPFVENFYRHVAHQAARDMIRLRVAGNGMHDTEIDRMTREGELRRIDDPSGIVGTLTFRHEKKGKGKDHIISLDAAAYAAAERMQARGSALSTGAYHDVLHATAMAIHGCGGVSRVVGHRKTEGRVDEPDRRIEPCPKCPRLMPNELRHSFATWARTLGEEVRPTGQRGVSIERVAERMGHGRNIDTTKGFYLGDHVPEMIRLPIHLTHPDDPKVTSSARGRGRGPGKRQPTRR